MPADLPPNLATTDRAVVRDLRSWGVPTPPTRIRGATIPIPAMTVSLAWPIAEASARGIRLDPTIRGESRASQHQILTHERLHIASAPWHQPGSAAPSAVCHEEASADAVSVDVTQTRFGPRRDVGPTYRPQTTWLRLASARATGRPWRSPHAQAWRLDFQQSDIRQRAALVAGDPIQCPPIESEEEA